MTTYQPPAAVTLPEPMAPGEFDALRRAADAAAAAEFEKVLAYYAPRAQAVTDALVRAAAERVRLLNKPVVAPDGKLGIVDSVHTNVHGDVLGHVRGWKTYPATYYAETLTVLTLDGKE